MKGTRFNISDDDGYGISLVGPWGNRFAVYGCDTVPPPLLAKIRSRGRCSARSCKPVFVAQIRGRYCFQHTNHCQYVCTHSPTRKALDTPTNAQKLTKTKIRSENSSSYIRCRLPKCHAHSISSTTPHPPAHSPAHTPTHSLTHPKHKHKHHHNGVIARTRGGLHGR